MTRRAHCTGMLLTAAVLAALSRSAHGDPSPADPWMHIHSPSHVTTDGGSNLALPPGYFVDEPTHDLIDTEFKRLQTVETRLTAENKSMRTSLDGWPPGFYTLATVLVGGCVLGYYIHDKL